MGRKKGISAKTAQKIADYFGVTVDRVLYGKRDADEKPTESNNELADYLEEIRDNPETRTLFAATKGMTKEQMQMMTDFAKFLRGEK